ncbi:MAG: O-antigen ligase family protein [Lachnospiraceae bacterium]|nr:O-antigen ligase family protein [Lachnospiraceae bacterium]
MKKERLPFYLIMAVPLIVYGKLYDTGLGEFAWYSDVTQAFDMLLYYKKNAVILAGCLILLLVVSAVFRKALDFKACRSKKTALLFTPLAVYGLLALISSLLSPYGSFAVSGMMEQFESIFVIGGYLLICVYSYTYCCEGFFTAIGISCAVIGAIGTLQMFGFDIYRTAFAKWLCMPQSLRDIDLQVTVEQGRTYCSLSNPNYVGMLCCLVVPLLTALAFCEEKRWKRILYAASDILMLCSLIGACSKSGIAVLAVCMLLLAAVFKAQILQGVRRFSVHAALGAALALCVVCALFAFKWSYFADCLHSILEGDDSAQTKIKEIATNDDSVKIVYRNRTLFISVDYDKTTLEEGLCVADENGKAYLTQEEDGALIFQDERLSKLKLSLVQYGDYIAVELWDGSFYWYFTNLTGDGTWYYLTRYGKPDKLFSAETPVYKGLEGREKLLNGRGYIWSRTIPLIKENLLLGSGQDSFAAVFPNDDYLGMARWGYKDMIITKPHCMYMQIAVQSGLCSLIMLVIFWAAYFIIIMRDKRQSQYSAISKSIAIGVLGYLLTGLTNDSNVGTAPLFWAILGIGLHLGIAGTPARTWRQNMAVKARKKDLTARKKIIKI